MKGIFEYFGKISAILTMCVGVGNLYAAQAPNPRTSSNSDTRSEVRSTQRGGGSANVVSRGATNRNVVTGNARSTAARTAVSPARGTTARTASSSKVVAFPKRADVTNVRSATPVSVSRSATTKANAGRSGRVNITKSGVGRLSRATAVFSDISKIGGGYGQCREAYATCMDQFCAAANDTYRRCFCSERFTEFRDTELALDEAKVLLQKFLIWNITFIQVYTNCKMACRRSRLFDCSVQGNAQRYGFPSQMPVITKKFLNLPLKNWKRNTTI